MAETLKIAERCTFTLDDIQYQYPKELVPEGHTPTTWLRVLTEEGTKTRGHQACLTKHVTRSNMS